MGELAYVVIAAGIGLLLLAWMVLRLSRRNRTLQAALAQLAQAQDATNAATGEVRQHLEEGAKAVAGLSTTCDEQQRLIDEVQAHGAGMDERFQSVEGLVAAAAREGVDAAERVKAEGQDASKAIGDQVRVLRNTSEERWNAMAARLARVETQLEEAAEGRSEPPAPAPVSDPAPAPAPAPESATSEPTSTPSVQEVMRTSGLTPTTGTAASAIATPEFDEQGADEGSDEARGAGWVFLVLVAMLVLALVANAAG